VPFVPTLSFQS